MIGRVHCHICPLKELCKYAEPEGSWRNAKTEIWMASGCGYDRPLAPTPEQEQNLTRATAFCPLRRAMP